LSGRNEEKTTKLKLKFNNNTIEKNLKQKGKINESKQCKELQTTQNIIPGEQSKWSAVTSIHQEVTIVQRQAGKHASEWNGIERNRLQGYS